MLGKWMRGRLAIFGVAAVSALVVGACGSEEEPSGSASNAGGDAKGAGRQVQQQAGAVGGGDPPQSHLWMASDLAGRFAKEAMPIRKP